MHDIKFELCKSLTHDNSISSFSVLHWSSQNMNFLVNQQGLCSVIEAMKSDENPMDEKYCSVVLLLWIFFSIFFLKKNPKKQNQKPNNRPLWDYLKS